MRIDSLAARHGDDAELRRHAATIRDCLTRLEEVEAANRTARRALAATTVALVTLVTLFGWSIWSTLRRQVTPEGLEAALQAKMAQLAPPLGEKLVEQVLGAMPAYRDLAAERAVKAWPAFSARVATEAESFATDTEAMVRARSQQALERVAGRLSDDLKRDFPGLTPKRLEALTRRLHDVLLAEGVGLGTEVEAIIAREADRIAIMLGRLPVEETAEQPETRLQKRFIHHLLMEIDDRVAAWPEVDTDAAPGTDAASPPPPPSPLP